MRMEWENLLLQEADLQSSRGRGTEGDPLSSLLGLKSDENI